MELDALRCLHIRCKTFDNVLEKEELRKYFNNNSLSGGGEITLIIMSAVPQSALIQFKTISAADDVLAHGVHFVCNAWITVSRYEWPELRTVEIQGLKKPYYEKIFSDVCLGKFVENIQKTEEGCALLTFIGNARDAIPEIRSRLSELNAHVYPYDSRRHAQRHPFIVYIEGLDKDLHMDLHKYLRLWKAIGPATEMFETGWTDNAFFLFSKVVDLKRVKKVLGSALLLSGVSIINCDQLSGFRPLFGIGDFGSVQWFCSRESVKETDEYSHSSATERLEQQVLLLKQSMSSREQDNEKLMLDRKQSDEKVCELQDEIRTLSCQKEEISCKYEKVMLKYTENTALIEQLEQQVKQHEMERTDWEKLLEDSKAEAKLLANGNRCQERELVERSRRILRLEASLEYKSEELGKSLEPLLAIPEIISSRCKALSVQIKDTGEHIDDRILMCHEQVREKMDRLLAVWDKFCQQDTPGRTPDSRNGSSRKNIPEGLKECFEKLSNTLGPNWLKAGRALGLDSEDLDRILENWGQYGMEEMAFRVMECWCIKFPKASFDDLKCAMASLETNPLDLVPMSEDDRKILVDNHSILLSDMFDVTIIDGYLRRARILSAPALEYILSTNTRYKRVRRLLIVLPFCGSRALGEFKEALKESGQTHLASALDDKSDQECTPPTTETEPLKLAVAPKPTNVRIPPDVLIKPTDVRKPAIAPKQAFKFKPTVALKPTAERKPSSVPYQRVVAKNAATTVVRKQSELKDAPVKHLPTNRNWLLGGIFEILASHSDHIGHEIAELLTSNEQASDQIYEETGVRREKWQK